MELTELFRHTLKEILKDKPRGAQSQLADELNIARGHISDFLGGRKPLSESKREQIANYFGYNYEDFLAYGRRLIEGEPEDHGKASLNDKIKPIDTAIRILNEVEEETGIKLTAKQRERVVPILREELKKKDKESKNFVKSFMSAFVEKK